MESLLAIWPAVSQLQLGTAFAMTFLPEIAILFLACTYARTRKRVDFWLKVGILAVLCVVALLLEYFWNRIGLVLPAGSLLNSVRFLFLPNVWFVLCVVGGLDNRTYSQDESKGVGMMDSLSSSLINDSVENMVKEGKSPEEADRIARQIFRVQDISKKP